MDCFPAYADKLIDILEDEGFSAYFVGGCVRDFILGREPNDFDITTSALPTEVLEIFRRRDFEVIPTGIQHGTVTVISENNPVEITTFRNDGSYSDSRHPDSVSFSKTFAEDAQRRDFTMNALAYNKSCGIVDTVGGVCDIKNRIVRTVGEPEKRFNEDALRILRAVRFASVLGFSIDEKTAEAVKSNANLLNAIANERISAEFTKLLCGKNVLPTLLDFADVIFTFIPEAAKGLGFEQHNYHHIYTVWEHICHVVDNVEPTPVLRLAAFFHDIAKPLTFSTDEKGIGHFYSHAQYSSRIAHDVLTRLKFDSKTIHSVETLVKYHDMQIPEDKKAVKRQISKLSYEAFADLMKLCKADTLSLAPEYSDRIIHFERLEQLALEIKKANECLTVKSLAITGSDLIALGIPQGREIGRILNEIFEAVMDEKLKNEREAIVFFVKSSCCKNSFDI